MIEKANPTSRFSGISPALATGVLSVTALLLIACLIVSRSGKRPPMRPGYDGWSDADVLYMIVQRVHRGENYYAAAGAELRAHNYSLHSVFNWRQPLYAWFLGALPTQVIGRIILIALTVFTILLATQLSRRFGDPLIALICFWMFTQACYASFLSWGPTELECVTGVLIAFSIFSFAADYWAVGVIAALLALFIRELAAPYVIVCLIMAVVNKRWRQVTAWIAGLLLYGAYFIFHVFRVLDNIRPSDPPSKSWIAFGGLHFILTTAGQHFLLLAVPLWVTAIYLPLALLGLTAIPGNLGRRATFTVAAYLVFFAIVGRSVNDYWGFIYGPLLAFGFAWAPLALFHLCQALMHPPMPCAYLQSSDR